MRYWSWLISGSGGRPGYQRFLDRWLLLHALVGGMLAWKIPVALADAANSVLLPLAGIFIGLCFAWGGNANALLQTDEVEDFAHHHPGGLMEYAYVYQSAILVILITLAFWGVAGLRFFDDVWPTESATRQVFAVKVLLYGLSSLTLRECWHVVLGAQSLLLARAAIRQASMENRRSQDGEND